MNANPTGNTLPIARISSLRPFGNPLPRVGNILLTMGKQKDKKPVEQILAGNYVRLRDKKKSDGTLKGLGVSPKTANNIEHARHNTKLTSIIKLADALGVEAYHMLIPVEENDFLTVLLAWAQSNEAEKGNLHAIAKAMLERKNKDDESRAPAPSAVHRRRDHSD